MLRQHCIKRLVYAVGVTALVYVVLCTWFLTNKFCKLADHDHLASTYKRTSGHLYTKKDGKRKTSTLVLKQMNMDDVMSSPALLSLEETRTKELVNEMHYQDGQNSNFRIHSNIVLPMSYATLPIQSLLRSKWMQDLQLFLSNISHQEPSPISIVSSDSRYQDLLVNWLITATVRVEPQLSNILVLALDEPLHKLLEEKGISSIYFPEVDYLKPRFVKSYAKRTFTKVMVLRMTVLRLLNYWGYDAANYDTDAIILKNPEPLYYKKFIDSDLIGSAGRYPRELKDMFGVTVCGGMFMLKSNPKTELYWTKLANSSQKVLDDQKRLNYALTFMELDWSNNNNTNDFLNKEWVAHGQDDFKVTILPGKYVCRQVCVNKHKSQYYVWHKGGDGMEGKLKYAKMGKLWVLRNNWTDIEEIGELRGREWLKALML